MSDQPNRAREQYKVSPSLLLWDSSVGSIKLWACVEYYAVFNLYSRWSIKKRLQKIAFTCSQIGAWEKALAEGDLAPEHNGCVQAHVWAFKAAHHNTVLPVYHITAISLFSFSYAILKACMALLCLSFLEPQSWQQRTWMSWILEVRVTAVWVKADPSLAPFIT